VAPDAYIPLESGANDNITGMAELAGQLMVLKAESIWGVNGGISVATNDNVALGTMVDPQLPDIYKTLSPIGCANRAGGNGAIVAGHPPLLYFNGATAFYAFDGINTLPVSGAITPTWNKFVQWIKLSTAYSRFAQQQAITYAIDEGRQILFLCAGQFHPEDGRDSPNILAYHYGLAGGGSPGAWTVINMRESGELDPHPVQAVCSSLGYGETTPFWYCGLHAITYEDGGMRWYQSVLLEDVDPYAHWFGHFRYHTGRLMVHPVKPVHVYGINWLHGRAPSPLALLFGWEADADGDVQTQSYNVDDGNRFRQPVGCRMEDIQLRIEGWIGDAYSRDVAILGWSLDTELVGQR
jgi:hypothetical protein